MKTRWTAIIPTLNRADLLPGVLACLVAQKLSPALFEILVIDNGSTDHTPDLVRAFIAQHPEHRIRYILEQTPGLTCARHRALREAKAEILTFFDDDVELQPDFSLHILRAFADEKAAMAGGPSVPLFACPPPDWVTRYFTWERKRLTCPYLSLFDGGDKAKDIDPDYIWGLNFSIRRQVALDLGGFHPDLVPQRLQVFQGDGETGLSHKVKENGLLARYLPELQVKHIIPEGRLTVDYFCKRFFFQGVCDSYTEIRRKKSLENLTCPAPMALSGDERRDIHIRIKNSYVDGYFFHQNAAMQSPAVFDWIVREDYLDNVYPELEDAASFRRDWAERILHDPLETLQNSQLLRLVQNYAGQAQWDEALRILRALDQASPSSAEIHAYISMVLLQKGDCSGAAEQAREALKIDPQKALAKEILTQSVSLAETIWRDHPDPAGKFRLENVDADPSFFYGEIGQADFLSILREGSQPDATIDGAVRSWCRRTGNEYFLEYALDPRRALGLTLLGDLEGKSVLDYGCGVGSLGIHAARHGADVVLVDNCLPRLRMAALRLHQEGYPVTAFGCKTWESLPASVADIDVVIVNGVLEWVPLTVGATFESALDTQLAFLRHLAARMAGGGKLYVAIENRFALQYLMGYPEDHTDIQYLSLMERDDANRLHKERKGGDFTCWTWGLDEFYSYLPQAGLKIREGYALFPDYRFPRKAVSLEDENALRRGLDMENYEQSPLRTRLADYFHVTRRCAHVVYSYALVLEKV